MYDILDMIVLIAGVYVLYQWYCLKFRREIKTGLLLNKDVDVNKCVNKDGYIKEASPMLIILALSCMIEAGINLFNSYVKPLPVSFSLLFVFAFIAVLIWFAMESKKLYVKYWDTRKKSIKR